MKFREKKVEKCWVGESQKICYATREEAEVAAQVAAYDYGAPELKVYKCEFGDHWHLSSKNGKAHIISCIFLILISVVLVVGFLNRDYLLDYFRATGYAPSGEMMKIRDRIELTENGEFIFDASSPVLDNRDDFNENCKTVASETAVLGCYTNKTIYIYNIESAELDGIREVTAAHELLHAVYARMDDAEKTDISAILNQVYKENMDVLQDDLDLYAGEERDEEIYVRVGTEIADLPEALERHYGRIFRNQDKIAVYYDNYKSVFRELKTELENLAAEMSDLNEQIGAKKIEYEAGIERLASEVAEFNDCAARAGCFASEAEFLDKRAELLAEQENLNKNYEEIVGLTEDYNAKVKIYNADVLRGKELNTIINSNQKPSEINI